MGSIYKITNTVNGKSYIGKTIHDAVKRRIRRHLGGYTRGSLIVKQAVEKYGKDAFTYEILHDGIISEFLDSYEIEAIAKHKTIAPYGYNLTAGGDGGSHSEETCKKIAESKKGKPLLPEHRRNVSKALKGRIFSDEHKQKLSEAGKHPMYYPTKEFYHSLSDDMLLKEKRERIREFSGASRATVLRWSIEWESEIKGQN